VRERKAAGADEIFQEKVSAIVTDRKALAKAIEALKKGDTLIVTRLDRLARSTRDLLNILTAIGDKGAKFKSLADAWADTTTSHGKLMITILGGLAEFERDLIRARTGEGRKRAKERGVHIGRPSKLTAHQLREVLERREGGERCQSSPSLTTCRTPRYASDRSSNEGLTGSPAWSGFFVCSLRLDPFERVGKKGGAIEVAYVARRPPCTELVPSMILIQMWPCTDAHAVSIKLAFLGTASILAAPM
jgi:hypothetical protein